MAVSSIHVVGLSLSFLLVLGMKLPSVPHHTGLSDVSLISSRLVREGERICHKRKVPVFCNINSEVTSPQCCHILLIRCKLLKGKSLHKDPITGGPIRAWLSHWSCCYSLYIWSKIVTGHSTVRMNCRENVKSTEKVQSL